MSRLERQVMGVVLSLYLVVVMWCFLAVEMANVEDDDDQV